MAPESGALVETVVLIVSEPPAGTLAGPAETLSMETFIWDGVCVGGAGVFVDGTEVLVGMGMEVLVGMGMEVPVGMGVPLAQGSESMVMLGMDSIMSCMSEQGSMGAAGAGCGLSTRARLRSPPETTAPRSLDARRAMVLLPCTRPDRASGMCSECQARGAFPFGSLYACQGPPLRLYCSTVVASLGQ